MLQRGGLPMTSPSNHPKVLVKSPNRVLTNKLPKGRIKRKSGSKFLIKVAKLPQLLVNFWYNIGLPFGDLLTPHKVQYVQAHRKTWPKGKIRRKQIAERYLPNRGSFTLKQRIYGTKGRYCHSLFHSVYCELCSFFFLNTHKEVCTLLR